MSAPTVAFEASALLGELTGVGIYARELLPPLATLVQPVLLLGSLRGATPAWISAPGGPGHGARVVRRRLPAKALLLAWSRLQRPRMERLCGPCDLVHSLNYAVVPTRKPLVVTLHDLWFLRQPQAGTRFGGRHFARDLRRNASRVDHWIAVSETTRRDALELLELPPERVTIVLEAPRQDFLRAPLPGTAAAHVRRRLGLPETYLLCYGNDDPRKNRRGLLEAYARLLDLVPDAPALLVVGGRKLDALPHVPLLWRPYLPDAEMHAVLTGALALVFPSLYEGFGLPVVEALALGVPVAASATGAIPEIARNDFVRLDPYDPDQMAAALARLVEDSALRQRLRQHGPRHTGALSWQRAARETSDVYRKLLGR